MKKNQTSSCFYPLISQVVLVLRSFDFRSTIASKIAVYFIGYWEDGEWIDDTRTKWTSKMYGPSVTLILFYTVSPSRSIKTIKYGFKDFYKRIEWKKFSSRWSFDRKLVIEDIRSTLCSICLFYCWDVFFMMAIRSPCLPSNIHYLSCGCLLSCLFIRHPGNLEVPTHNGARRCFSLIKKC